MKKKIFTLAIILFLQTYYLGQQISAPYLFPNQLNYWEIDHNSKFNVSVVPLAERFINSNSQVNSNVRNKEIKIVSLSTMHEPVSNSPAQFGDKFDIYSFSNWQYIDMLIYWGGSATEGIIVPPTAEVTDAAHRNGVKVLGTIFFPPVDYGGKLSWLDETLLKVEDKFPIADKLMQMAKYFNFDGWFINQETAGSTIEHADLMIEFIEYIRSNSNLHIMWYDAMTINGDLVWQGQLNKSNADYLLNYPKRSNSMFIDFRWKYKKSNLIKSSKYAKSINFDPYSLFAGLEINGAGDVIEAPYNQLIQANNSVSIGLFSPHLIFSKSRSQIDFQINDNKFWTGENEDPRNTRLDHQWPGAAHFVNAKSVISKLPFSTHFNTGNGKQFYINGNVSSNKQWYNRSLQDILPTWRWIITGGEKTLTPSFSWEDSYFGGSCLNITGELKKSNVNEIKLYNTNLELTENTSLKIIHNQSSNKAISKLGLKFSDDIYSDVYLDFSTEVCKVWKTRDFSLNEYAGKTITEISIRFEPIEDDSNYNFNLGELLIFNRGSDKHKISDLKIDTISYYDDYSAMINLSWQNNVEEIYANLIFRKSETGSLEYLGSTPNNVINLPSVERINGETKTELLIQAIGNDFKKSSIYSINHFWRSNPPNNPPVAQSNGPYYSLVNQELVFTTEGSFDKEKSIKSFEWFINDSLIGTGDLLRKKFELAGKYKLALKVTDSGLKHNTENTHVYISNRQDFLNPDLLWIDYKNNTKSILSDSSNKSASLFVNEIINADNNFDAGAVFNGTTSYMSLEEFQAPDSTITVSLWALAKTRPVWASLIKNWAGESGAFHFGLMNNDGDLEVQVCQSDNKVIFLREGKDNKFPLNKWQHIAFVANGNDIVLYRNGEVVDKRNYNGTLKTTLKVLGIGVKLDNDGNIPNAKNTAGFWNGQMEDIRIYKRPLNIQEIRNLYNNNR